MKKYGFIAQLLAIFILSCSDRDQIGSRINSYDGGGDNCKYDGNKPTVTASVNSYWYDYNFKESSGNISIQARGKDLDLPYDTLRYRAYYGLNRSSLDSVYGGTDSLLLLNGIKRGTAYYCSLVVADKWDSVSYVVKNFTAPKEMPPPPPAPGIYYYSSGISIEWQSVSEAEEYKVYRADSVTGEFKYVSTVSASSYSSMMSYTDYPYDYSPKYFIVASVNDNGECRSVDTVEARKTYSSLATPSISSVSQGTYKTHIAVRWSSYSDAAVYQLYRSLSSDGPYELIATVDSLRYNDTAPTADHFYYRLAYLDSKNRSSPLSSYFSGYRYSVGTPSLSDVYCYADYLSITWYAITGAKAYVVFRSTGSCSSNDFVPIDTVTGTNYHDSVDDTSTYYYRVASIDSSNSIGVQSSCDYNKLTSLSSPSLSASRGSYKDRICLNWNTVGGATSYIIYRSENTSSYEPIDTVTGTSYYDTIKGDYYYTVCAYNKRGPGYRSDYAYGYTTRPISCSASDYTYGIYLDWSSESSATRYYIYKSTDNKNFTKFDSTTYGNYTDSTPYYGLQYYKVSYRTSDGESELSASAASGYRSLSSPANLKEVDILNGVKLTWNKTPGADSYVIYSCEASYYSYYARDTVTDTTWIDSLGSNDYTRYNYHVTAQNQLCRSSYLNTVTGGIATPPNASSSVSTNSYADYIQFSWSTPSSGSNPDGYYIYRGLSSTGTFELIDSTKQTIYNDSVPDGNYYYYKVAGYNVSGTGEKSSSISAKRMPPRATSSINGNGFLYSSFARVSWKRSLDKATTYKIYRSEDNGVYTVIGSVSDTFFNDSSAVPGKKYYYKVSSVNEVGEGSSSANVWSGRLAPPSSITVTGTQTGIIINWENPTLYTVNSYNVYRSNNSSGPFTKIATLQSPPYTDIGIPEALSYYKVSSVNLEESSLSPVSAGVKCLYPDPPTGLSASRGTYEKKIQLNWNSTPGASEYKIYRSTDSAFLSSVVLIKTTSSNTFSDSVTSDSIYYYAVKSVNTGGESSLSKSAAGFILPSQVPLPPVNVSATDTISDYVRIEWKVQSGSAPINGYKIFRSDQENGTYTLKDNVTDLYYNDYPPNSYPDTYWYKVKAVNGKGESEFSEAVNGYRK